MSVYVLGVSGASGAMYSRRVMEGLLAAGHDLKAVFTAAGRRVFELELDVHLPGAAEGDERLLCEWLGVRPFGAPGSAGGTLQVFDSRDVGASIASGSFKTAGMAVVPCSMGTLGRIAHGISTGLLERAADTMLKERRPLVLVPRETPLSLVHLRNMMAATEVGATILPAMPGFYHRPQAIQDLVDMVAGRVLDRLGVESSILRRWEGAAPPEFAGLEDL